VGLHQGPLLWGAVLVSALLQVLVVSVPLLNEAFDTVPLSFGDWLMCIALGSVVLWLDELKKLVVSGLHRRPAAAR
jgi:magnesium-transporting ATPase (P-type)